MTRPDFTITADDGPRARRVGPGVRPADAAPGPRPGHRHRGGRADPVRVHPGGRLPGLRPQGPDHPDPAVHRRLAPHRRTRPAHTGRQRRRRRGPGRRRPDDEAGGRSGCGRPGGGRTCPTCPGCKIERPHRRAGVHHARPASSTGRDVRHLHPALLRAGAGHRGSEASRATTTTGGPRWTRCTSPSCAAGSGPTCAAAPGTTCSTSPSSKPNAGSPRICTPPSAARSPARSSARSSPPPTTPCGGRPSTRPSTYDRLPSWTGPEHGYADPDTGEVLPTWAEALDRLDTDPDAKPAHVMRFGTQLDLQGVIPEHADQAVRYLAKYLTKAIGETHTDADRPRPTSGTSTGCTPNCGGCRARRGARTGSATASNPTTPSPA